MCWSDRSIFRRYFQDLTLEILAFDANGLGHEAKSMYTNSFILKEILRHRLKNPNKLSNEKVTYAESGGGRRRFRVVLDLKISRHPNISTLTVHRAFWT